jgi:plastocyanin
MTADRRFDPVQVNIATGQSVLWQNQSRSPNTVTCDPSLASNASSVILPSGAQPFNSGVVNPNGTFSHTFTTPGTYQYVSLPFEAQSMFGTVNVQG